MRSQFFRSVPTVAFAVATAVYVRPVSTLMEARTTTKERRGVPAANKSFRPSEVYYDEAVKEALGQIRMQKREEIKEEPKILESSGTKNVATLTLIGFKGGSVESQINQDRTFCIAPYYKNEEETSKPVDRQILGVFDGHANFGERVAEYTSQILPKVLAAKLHSIGRNVFTTAENEPLQISKALVETFIEIDKSCPAEVSGGCSASVILKQGSKIYIANAGDSRSFVVVYRAKSQSVEVVYISREDKPSLPDEAARVHKMGGQVFLPPVGTSRVLYVDSVTGNTSGLAMSRSIGDWEAGRVGVIPDPIVDVVDIPELIKTQMAKDCELDVDGNVDPACLASHDDVCIFAVSATDGMMDFASPELIAQTVALSLYAKEGPHLLTALEQLIYMAAQGWEQFRQGQYRDDIAIAVSQLRIPPGPPSQ